jgi:hypothetical protein
LVGLLGVPCRARPVIPSVRPSIKITPRAFGKDWRLPIVNRFRE